MARSLHSSVIFTALCVLGVASPGRAQTTPPPSAAPTADSATTPVLKPGTPAPDATAAEPTAAKPPTAPKHERTMSNAVASFLADGAPKYNPPPKVPEAKTDEEPTDLRETDRPKNRIIRLPKYVVKEPTPPVFSEPELRSREEQTRVAMARFYGLHMGNIGGLNEPIALFMYQEQERLKDQSEMKEEARNAKNSGDTSAADYISKQTNRSFYRPSDFGWNSDGGGK